MGGVETRAESDLAVVRHNSGSAVPPDQIERLFEPFQRLGRDRVGSGDHHGLGLSIVSAIAVAMTRACPPSPVETAGSKVSVSFPVAPS